MFSYAPGAFSYARGKAELFAELRAKAMDAASVGDDELLDRIFEYVRWADQQTSSEALRSAADIEFFMPIVSDSAMRAIASSRLPKPLFDAKERLTTDTPQ